MRNLFNNEIVRKEYLVVCQTHTGILRDAIQRSHDVRTPYVVLCRAVWYYLDVTSAICRDAGKALSAHFPLVNYSCTPTSILIRGLNLHVCYCVRVCHAYCSLEGKRIEKFEQGYALNLLLIPLLHSHVLHTAPAGWTSLKWTPI
jgi:hypothetical protein